MLEKIRSLVSGSKTPLPKKELLFEAIAKNNAPEAQRIISEMPEDWIPTLSRVQDKIPLHHAATQGSLEVTVLLMSKFSGALTFADSSGRKPLHIAVINNHYKIAEMMKLAEPQVIRFEDLSHRTPIDYAIANGNIDLYNMLNSPSAQQTGQERMDEFTADFKTALEYDQLALITHIIKHYSGEATKYRDDAGLNICHIIARHPELSEDSFSSVASSIEPYMLTETDDEGNTPAHLAALSNNFPAVKLFTEISCNQVAAPNNKGQTPLQCAIIAGDIISSCYLLSISPAAAGIFDKEGLAPIHYAAKNGMAQICRALRDIDESLCDIADQHGQLTLFYARLSGCAHTIASVLGASESCAYESCSSQGVSFANSEHAPLIDTFTPDSEDITPRFDSAEESSLE